MPALTRILSDVHYGDPASHITELKQLAPLFEGADQLVFNGDTLDTRPGPNSSRTTEQIKEVREFLPRQAPRVTFLTGNHDPDFSPLHCFDAAGGAVFVVHGDIFFPNLVPWSRDVPLIERLISAERQAADTGHGSNTDTLVSELALIRRVCVAVPQRHQAHERGWAYLRQFLSDTVWPPTRVLKILGAWRTEPAQAAALLHAHRPAARFIIAGHTHRPALWRLPNGRIAINTGSYTPPFGATVVDLTEGLLRVRAVRRLGAEFHLGRTVAEFPLAP